MNSPYWFEVAVVFGLNAVGNIFFERFAVGTPKWRRVLKLFGFAALAVLLSATAGRGWFFVLLAVLLLALLVVHAWWLPRNGIDGWTGEPRANYHAFRGGKTK